MIEIAGLVVSGIGLVNDLIGRYQDLMSWTEAELPVDDEWLGLALEKGVLDGKAEDYLWSREEKVATRELRGTASVVVPFNDKTRVKYRVFRGRPGDRLILMKKTAAR